MSRPVDTRQSTPRYLGRYGEAGRLCCVGSRAKKFKPECGNTETDVAAHGGGGLRGAPLARGAGAAPSAAPAGSGGGSSGLESREQGGTDFGQLALQILLTVPDGASG